MPGLKNMPSYIHLEGTIRATTPAETLARLRPLYSKMGITRIADISNLDILGLPVVSAVRPMAKNLSIALGKGISTELAEISAVMESIEGYHAENLPPAELTGSYKFLKEKGHPVIDPAPFAKGVLQHPNIQELELDWLKAEFLQGTGVGSASLLRQSSLRCETRDEADPTPVPCNYVPYTLVNLDLTSSRPESYYFQVSSNGLAAGNTLAEATCHALYELIERDAFFHFGQQSEAARQTKMLDLSSIRCPAFEVLHQHIVQKSLLIKVWDITHHMQVPSFHCCLYDESLLSPIYFSSGSGSHFSKEVALLRAVTEAIQGRTALISGTRDDIYPNYYLYQQKLLLERSQGNQTSSPLLQWDESIQPKFSNTFEANVTELLQRMGTGVYRVDLTSAELNIPVVFVIAAQLHFTGMRM